MLTNYGGGGVKNDVFSAYVFPNHDGVSSRSVLLEAVLLEVALLEVLLYIYGTQNTSK